MGRVEVQLYTLLTSTLDGGEQKLYTSAALPMGMALEPVSFKCNILFLFLF